MPGHGTKPHNHRDLSGHWAAPEAAGEILAELGGAACPSVSGLIERLIDRAAALPRAGEGRR